MNSSKTCAYAVALVLSAAASHALAEAADKADTLEEVIITAQKRAQNLQDVPLSVTAIGAEQLEVRGIEIRSICLALPTPFSSCTTCTSLSSCSSLSSRTSFLVTCVENKKGRSAGGGK